jgi:hypothetical protein
MITLTAKEYAMAKLLVADEFWPLVDTVPPMHKKASAPFRSPKT